ncbi:hypothetical protein FACS1894176_07130 [Bacteroidia bacterium]|nr:hypothetical protein FACS189428_1660 [Clostridia bacterium]GHV26421.1 hypothetical protein FACS1894176_07130 [Bacteroidia bacterium]
MDGPTDRSITATISFNKSGVIITNDTGSDTYTFTKNGDFTFEFKDSYGQTGSSTAKVNWIIENDFDYTGGPTTFTAYTQGYYKLQVRGAE